jgi:hypothetical protein
VGAAGIPSRARWRWASGLVRHGTGPSGRVRHGTGPSGRHGTGPPCFVSRGVVAALTARPSAMRRSSAAHAGMCLPHDAGGTPGRPPTAAPSGLPSGRDGLAVGPAALQFSAGLPRRSGRLASPACVEPLFVFFVFCFFVSLFLFVCLFDRRGGLGRGRVRYAARPDRCAGWL